jgi:hypothetical protein
MTFNVTQWTNPYGLTRGHPQAPVRKQTAPPLRLAPLPLTERTVFPALAIADENVVFLTTTKKEF